MTSQLTRVEYLRLRAAGLGTVDALTNAGVDGGDEERANSVLERVRQADDQASEAA